MDEQKLLKKKRQAQKDHNWRTIAEFSNKLGALYCDNGDYEQAIAQFKDEFEAYKALGMKMEAGHAQRMIGEMLMYQGEYEAALKFATNYLKTAVDEKNKVEEQRAHATIARIHLVHGQSEDEGPKRQKIINEAEKAFLRAALACNSIKKQIGSFQAADMEARIYLNLGVCKEYCEDYEKAAEHMQTAIQIAKKFDLHELLYQCYTSAGLMHSLRTGDTRKSLLMFNLAMQTAERLPEKTKKSCEVLQMKADVSLKIGDIRSAKQSLVQAFKMKSGNDKILQETIEKQLKTLIAVEKAQDELLNSDSQEYEVQKGLYETLGDGWCQLGNYGKAIEYYLKMLGCAELDGVSSKELVPIYVSLYQTYRDNKQYNLALTYMKKEHELIENNPKEACDTLVSIAEVQELAGKSFFEIEETLRKALTLAKTTNDDFLAKKVIFKLLQLCRKHGMIDQEEIVAQEILENGFTVKNLENLFENEEILAEEEPDTPDIGHDIDLNELFQSDDEERNDQKRSVERRKRTGINLQMKRNQKGETPLHLACISGNLTLVRQLLDQGHELIVRDNAGWIPLHEACNHGFKEIVEELLTRGANRGINDRGGTKCDGVTPLYDACSNGNLEIVELLLERGADPTMKTNDGDSALHALELWRENAVGLTAAEENLYKNLHHKIKHSLEKTGNLNISKDSETKKRLSLSRSSSFKDLEVRSTSSSGSRHTPKVRNIRKGLDISSDDDSEVEFSSNTSKITSLVPTKSSETLSEQKRARSDYKEVMSKLRKPHSSNNYSPYSAESTERKQSALISTTNLDDDWLEDDLGPNRKKQKIIQEPILPRAKDNFRRSTSFASPTKKVPSQEIDSTIDDLADWDSVDNFDAFADENDVPLWQSTAKQKTPPRKSNPIKRQTSLMGCGFSLRRSDSPRKGDNLPDSTINEHFPVIYASPSPVKVVAPVTGLKTIVVKIADELISVPVKVAEIDNLDVEWLVNEVKRRYSNLFGRSPEIRITLDNALVETTDPLAIVFTATEVGARILKFNTISLMNRYRAACQELKFPILEDVINAFEQSLSSKRLNLEDLMLTSDEIQPISNAIKQETELVFMNFDNNCLQNSGLKHLSEVLGELKALEDLRLSGNLIEVDGIKALTGNSIVLENLTSLTLDFNPLGNDGVKVLFEKGPFWCPNLTKLSMAACDIKIIEGNPTILSKLTHLDFSENALDRKSLDFIAKNINRERIKVLKLNNMGNNSLNWFPLFVSPFAKLEELYLASNTLTDDVIRELLSSCTCLNLLDLSHNSSLTSTSFEFFMRNVALRKIYLNGCQNLLPSPSLPHVNSTADLSLPEYMELTLNITNPMEREQQEKYMRKIWDDCYNNNNNDDDDNGDDAAAAARNTRKSKNRVGYVKVNKFQLTAFVLDTTD
ncbi:tonsoku-like protein [Culicoides brevitarsis]|uniref:tonsoku-like protein n=1 Tax=Culicoides brevitarsis TaxID=469753 RepID=UPI00307C4A2C